MDGRSSTGSPSAASSRRLPAHPDTPQPADTISASEDSRDSVGLLGSQEDQRPAETQQSPTETHQSTSETHQSPAETHQSPAETHQSPAETHQRPVKTNQSPEETHQSPAETHQRPVKTNQSPEETHQSTSETHQRPAETHQRPVKTNQSPAETHQRPAETHQRPVKTNQSPAETHQRPVKINQSPAETHQRPAETHQSPAETHQRPVKTNQSPAETHQRPAETHQSPAETHQRPVKINQSPAETHQRPAETHQSPAETHQRPVKTNQSPAETHQRPAETHQSPAEIHQRPAETHQSPAETHQSPAETHQSPAETHQSTSETHQSTSETHQSPAETHQSPAETHQSTSETQQSPAENHQSPVKTNQSPTETHQSPAKTHQSPAKKHPNPAETHWSPAEKHQRLTEIQWTAKKPHHLGPTKYINWKDSPTEKQEPEDCPTKPDPLKPNLLPTEQHNPGDSPLTEKQKTKDQREPDQPSPTQPEQTDPLCPDQKKPGDLFCPEYIHQTWGGLCLTNQKTEEDPPPPIKDLAIFTSAFNKQNQEVELHLSEFKDQQNHQNLPAEKPTSTTPKKHQDHQDCSLPAHLSTQHSPPPPSEVLPLIIHPTENFTQAPLVQAPPVQALLVQTPPIQVPLVQTPPVQTPMVQAPSVQALPVQTPSLTIEVFSDQVRPCSFVSPKGEPKLCGFLQKQGGPLRAWKQRWFTYEEKKNQLFYYRTPQDVTPLGRVELCSATFTYPLKGEKGTFHIKTPERTFTLKAVSQELMLYWLQQLQSKRWQHRQTSTCPDLSNNNSNNNNNTDDFLPVLKSPLGLVGDEAANVVSQRAPFPNVSIKHPLIELQNSVHSLRKRSSQDGSQSVFHVEAPLWIPPSSADTSCTTDTSTGPVTGTRTNIIPLVPRTPREPLPPPPALSLAEPAGQVTPTEVRELESWNWKLKRRSLSTLTTLRRDTVSSDRMTRLQQEKEILMEEVKAQKELVWILHKALEASQLEKRTCAEFLAEKGEQERLEVLRHRERQAADLRGRLEDAKTEAETTRMSLAQRDAELVQLQDYIGMLMEKNNAKQEVIIKLSDQVTACMSSAGGSDSQTFQQLQQEIENLRDDIEAYKIQNKFLNSEIYQLTKLWRTSSEQEKSLMAKCAYLEASNCQVESRYLGVLRQLHETRSLDPVQRAAIQKMIEDALKGELKSIVKLNVARDHDEYGFKIIPDYEVEDMKLLAKIQALEIRSHNLLHQEGGEHPLLSRWAQYLAGRSDNDLCPSPELKGLLRGGVPQEYRQRVWRWMVRTRTRTIREHHPRRYQQLCEKSRTCPHPASRQIELDLHRTLTTNQYFSSPSSPALQQLRRVLLAFSWQNPAIGYCQGLNRLAAITLLVLQSEEDAFWCLVAVVETIIPQDYYTKNLVASQADQRVLKDFLAEKLPRLAAHFEDHSIDVSLITFNWFLVVFVESLPSDILLPLWDAFLYEGTKVIFRYALALFKYKEDDILKIQDSVEIYQYLRFFTKTISDGRRLTSIAFNDMNPFPGRLLRNRRALHLERLQGELRELEEQQREFVSESAERKDKDLDTMVSEDEEEL